MVVTVNRDGVCMSDDSIEHRKEIILGDNATGRDLLNHLLQIGFLPELTDAVWYTWSLKAPCIVAYSTKEKRIIAEVQGIPLDRLGTSKSFEFCHCWLSHDLNRIMEAIQKTDGIWYDTQFFENRAK